VFHFLVTAKEDAWELPAYEYERERFGEHTAASLLERYKSLSARVIEELKSYPALFAYEGRIADEGRIKDLRVGYIRRIKERSRSVLIEYEFETGIAPIPAGRIVDLMVPLDIEKWEWTRTHWAIKDEDLLSILHAAGLVDASFVSAVGPAGRVEETRFKVALSFPGEKRTFVEAVATELKKRLPPGSVFYDRDFTPQLARPNLDTLLQRIYLNNSDLVVVFLCAEYQQKEWCGLEWRAVREIIKNKSDHAVMFMRFDQASVDGSFSIDGYVDLGQYTPVQAARLIVERVRANELP